MRGVYTIRKGKHYSRPRWPYLFWGTKMSRGVRFDKSCLYTGLPGEQEPVNKLFGFGELWPGMRSKIEALGIYGAKEAGTSKPLHHEASARFGWNCDEHRQLWLYAYTYACGMRDVRRLCMVKPEQRVGCSIEVLPDHYLYRIEAIGHHTMSGNSGIPIFSVEVHTTRTGPGKAFGYGLFPYFGGPDPAPHDMTILIQ